MKEHLLSFSQFKETFETARRLVAQCNGSSCLKHKYIRLQDMQLCNVARPSGESVPVGWMLHAQGDQKVSQGGCQADKPWCAVHYKDEKKGQQDTFQMFFEAVEAVGFTVKFPDTSNTCYQSHCNTAAILIYLPLYRGLLEVIHNKKEAGDQPSIHVCSPCISI